MILRPHVVHYVAATGNSFILIHDNAKRHTTGLVENMLEIETMQCVKYPACSSELNPIQYVSDTFGRRTAAKAMPRLTARDSEIAFLEEWISISKVAMSTSLHPWKASVKLPSSSRIPHTILHPLQITLYNFHI